MKIPLLPLSSEAQELVNFAIYFGGRDLTGFMEVYEMHLKQYGKPGVAYEATEMLHFELFKRRRFYDRESFKNGKSQYYRRQYLKKRKK